MKFLNRLTLLSFIMTMSTFASAQERSITLEQALEQTLSENKQTEIDRISEEVDIFKRKAAKGLRSPQFGFSAAYTHLSSDIAFDLNNMKAPVAGIIGQLPPQLILPEIKGLLSKDWKLTLQDKDFAMLGASVKMPIFMGGKINAANRAAKVQLNITKEQSAQNKDALYSELIERYYGVSLAMQAVEVREEVLNGMKLHLSEAILLEEKGIIAKVERLYAQMKCAEAETELQKAKAELSTIMTALKNTINESSTPGKVFPISSMFVLTTIEEIAHFKSLAIENNSILKQIDLKRQLATEAMKVERAAFMPQIAAIGGVDIYNYQLTSLAPRWAVGAGLTFNIFDGLHRENNVRAAKSKIRQVEAIKLNAADDIQTLIEKLYNELTSTKSVYDTYDIAIEFSTEYLRAKEVAFKNGMAVSKDVVDAQLLLSKNKIERLQAAFKYDVTLAKMLENCGVSHMFLTYKNSNNFIPVYFTKQ